MLFLGRKKKKKIAFLKLSEDQGQLGLELIVCGFINLRISRFNKAKISFSRRFCLPTH